MNKLGLRSARKLTFAGIKISLIELRSCEFRQKLALPESKKRARQKKNVNIQEGKADAAAAAVKTEEGEEELSKPAPTVRIRTDADPGRVPKKRKAADELDAENSAPSSQKKKQKGQGEEVELVPEEEQSTLRPKVPLKHTGFIGFLEGAFRGCEPVRLKSSISKEIPLKRTKH